MNSTIDQRDLTQLSHYLQPHSWDAAVMLRFSGLSGTFPSLQGAEWQKFVVAQPICWQPALLLACREHLAPPSLKNVSRLAQQGGTYLANTSTSIALLQAPLGDLSAPQHLFNANVTDWGFRLTEQQAIQGLQHFLNQTPERCLSFVQSIFRLSHSSVTPSHTPQPLSLQTDKIDFMDSCTVNIATYPISRWRTHKRHQLVIRWIIRRDGHIRPQCLSIDCHLGPAATKMQEFVHRPHADEQDDDNHAVILSPQRSPVQQTATSRCRPPINWRSLLCCWERQLTSRDDADREFSRFRRTLWEYTATYQGDPQ